MKYLGSVLVSGRQRWRREQAREKVLEAFRLNHGSGDHPGLRDVITDYFPLVKSNLQFEFARAVTLRVDG